MPDDRALPSLMALAPGANGSRLSCPVHTVAGTMPGHWRSEFTDWLRRAEDSADGRDGSRLGTGRLRRPDKSRRGDRDSPSEQPVRDAQSASPGPDRVRPSDPGPRAARVVVARRGEHPERDGLGPLTSEPPGGPGRYREGSDGGAAGSGPAR